jgi:hypothetical protein
MIALNQSLYLLPVAGYESIHRLENYLIAMLSVSHLTNIGWRVKIIARNFAGTKFLSVCRLLANAYISLQRSVKVYFVCIVSGEFVRPRRRLAVGKVYF